ncbi:MAG TPA: PilZ domain-containing protein [Acidothermaceae bacterium]|jgi:c-di-GMP-binding flagellar brake protein YcgR
MSMTMSRGLASPGIDAPVVLRIAASGKLVGEGHEFATQVEDVEADAVVVRAPAGANSVLLASGSRDVELSWMSPRGRYEQPCRVLGSTSSSGNKLWRLRPMRRPMLIQRRRYIRVRACLDVVLDLDGESVPATTVDISEGGFRVRLPRREIPDLQRTVVRTVIGRERVAAPGYVVRTISVDDGQQTEAVVAFDIGGPGAEAIRRHILHLQLRARAKREP